MSLAEARSRHKETQRQRFDNKDPMAERAAEKKVAQAPQADSFETRPGIAQEAGKDLDLQAPPERAQLLPRRAADDDRPEENALAIYLGLDVDDLAGSLWPTLGDAALAAGVTRPALTNALVSVRARWLKSPIMTEVREELDAVMQANGGVLTVAEAGSSLLASRGSIEQDDALRLRLAAAVLRATVESEADLATPRFQIHPAHAARAGGFLALTVTPRLTRHAEAEIVERFARPQGFRRVSLDQLILSCLKEEASTLRVDWQKVMEADQAGPGGQGWNNFMRLAGRAKPHILARLLAEPTPLLLVPPGLLARLDLMAILTELQGAAARADGIAAVWVLAPMEGQGLPSLNGVPIPVISSAQVGEDSRSLAGERSSLRQSAARVRALMIETIS